MGALEGSDLLALGIAADQQRRALHPENVVTYQVVAPAGLLLEQAVNQESTHGSGAVMLDTVADISSLPVDQLEPRLRSMHREAPSVTFHHLPIAQSGVEGAATALDRLHAAGLRSLVLQVAGPLPQQTESLLRLAASHSIGVTLVYTIGRGESAADRVAALMSIRLLQQATHAVQAMVLRIHHASTPEARREEEATAVDYLKTLAVTRIFLDNVEHVVTEWDVMGPKVLELALRFGADDADRVPWSEDGRVGPSHHGGETELRRIIRDAGFRPVERDALFRQSLLR